MRTMAAWMLGAGLAIAILGCEDKNKTTPVMTAAPAQTVAPAPYPGDANVHHGTGAMPGEPMPPADTGMNAGASPAAPVAPAPEPEPVDTTVTPPKSTHKATRKSGTASETHKSTGSGTKERSSAREGNGHQQGPKESYPRKEKGARTYTVKKGDTLQEISQKFYGTTTKWRSIYKANEKKIGTSPDKLTEGTKLTIP